MTPCSVQVWWLQLAPAASELSQDLQKYTELSLEEAPSYKPADDPKNSRCAKDILQRALLQLNIRLIVRILGP